MSDKDDLYDQTTIKARKLLAEVIWELEVIKKTGRNPFFKKGGKDAPYATLNDILAAVKPHLKKRGLYLTQCVGKNDRGHHVTSAIMHPELNIPIDASAVYLESTDNMQKLGAAITYARRYGLISLLGIEDEDDDGNMATGKTADPKESVGELDRPTVLLQITELLSNINDPIVTKACEQKLATNPGLTELQSLKQRLINKLGEKK